MRLIFTSPSRSVGLIDTYVPLDYEMFIIVCGEALARLKMHRKALRDLRDA